MLTETYTLVALSVEQTSVRVGLQSLQKLLETNFVHRTALTASQVEYVVDNIRRLYDACHWRKLDKFLIPAIRRTTRAADSLLQELDALTQTAADAMATVQRCAAEAVLDTGPQVTRFCNAVSTFCSALLLRIAREEQELFAMARAVITGEAWFAIANQMLASDAYQQENRVSEPAPRARRGSIRSRIERAHRQGSPLSFAH